MHSPSHERSCRLNWEIRISGEMARLVSIWVGRQISILVTSLVMVSPVLVSEEALVGGEVEETSSGLSIIERLCESTLLRLSGS
jgi:hypothetical protein